MQEQLLLMESSLFHNPDRQECLCTAAGIPSHLVAALVDPRMTMCDLHLSHLSLVGFQIPQQPQSLPLLYKVDTVRAFYDTWRTRCL